MNTGGQSFPFLMFPLLGMVLLWLALIKLLCHRLKSLHPRKYESMGRPSLVRNGPAEIWALFRFLMGREHRVLGDRYLTNLSHAMLLHMAAYLLLLALLLVSSGLL